MVESSQPASKSHKSQNKTKCPLLCNFTVTLVKLHLHVNYFKYLTSLVIGCNFILRDGRRVEISKNKI